ncbi:alpha/beta hydrolase [Mucilaginibacter sp.]|uniref:alpha/beta hydrolase n=1 Tax=Mucilaginibacter sp. TaxID=1882438 RepID=UPI002634E451|nr:alpha/beta hydrolase [Mucilaginibacter sp.]MDB4924449.1 lip2 [Mucilaginibacter sp.]
MIRLIPISLYFLISLLAIFKAPTYHLWLLAVLVTEFPLIFAGITTLLTVWGIWVQLAGMLIGVMAVLLFFSPIVSAYIISSSLKPGLAAAFGKDNNNAQPFSLGKLFAGNKDVPYNTATYVTYRDTTLTLDFYPSQIPGKRPCVIVIHGGSWSTGDSKQLPGLNSHLAKLGYNVAAINYRMAPKYHNPAAVNDTEAALKYLHEHAAELKIDTNNFVLLGRSAGAQIALLAAYMLHNKGIKGVIDFYGPADMVWGYSAPASPLVMDSRGVMESYLGGTYKQVPHNYVASSPIEFVNRLSVPTLIIHGYNDVLVAYEHSRRLNEKLQQNGIKHYWLKLPWATHGFDYNLNGPSGQLSTYAVDGFLKAITK